MKNKIEQILKDYNLAIGGVVKMVDKARVDKEFDKTVEKLVELTKQSK